LNAESAELTTYTLELDYDYWSTGERLIILDITLADILSLDEILQAILPEELCDGSPTGFSMTGHLGMLLYCTKFIFTYSTSQPT